MAYIHSIDYYLPKKELSNKELSSQFPEWNVEKISSKTGISKRFIAADDEFASDMGIKAANKLFEKNKFDRSTIDFLIYCSQSPDYLIPTTARRLFFTGLTEDNTKHMKNKDFFNLTNWNVNLVNFDNR